MDVFAGTAQFAQDQIDCIECKKQQKVLNEDIVKLKNFVNRYKPNQYSYKRDLAGLKNTRKTLKSGTN